MDPIVRRARSHFISSQVFFNILSNNVQIYNMAEQNNSLHTLIAFAVFVLLGFLQLKHPQSPTPFQIHPNTTLASIASCLAYCFFTLLAKLRFFHIHFIINTILMEVFGSLSLVSLVLMLLPEHTNWGESLKLVIYTLWFLSHVVAFIIRTLYPEHMRRRVMPPLLPY